MSSCVLMLEDVSSFVGVSWLGSPVSMIASWVGPTSPRALNCDAGSCRPFEKPKRSLRTCSNLVRTEAATVSMSWGGVGGRSACACRVLWGWDCMGGSMGVVLN